MAHLALLGDSVFDNGAYTSGGPAVIAQLRRRMPLGWRATLAAQDGAMTANVAAQLAALPADVERLVVSVGGNDVLRHAHLLEAQVTTSAEAIDMIGEAAQGFEAAYRDVVALCLHLDRRAVICTIYGGNFPDPAYQRLVKVALAPFNDAIIRAGVMNGLTVIDLRLVCDQPADYANPIEPSSIGGEKIAKAIIRAVTNDASRTRAARVIG